MYNNKSPKLEEEEIEGENINDFKTQQHKVCCDEATSVTTNAINEKQFIVNNNQSTSTTSVNNNNPFRDMVVSR